MPKSNVHKLPVHPKPLTPDEVKRLAETLAGELEHDTKRISLVTLLFTHLESVFKENPADLEFAFYYVRQHLFIGTGESDAAQEQFQANAYQNRAKLLRWPGEGGAS